MNYISKLALGALATVTATASLGAQDLHYGGQATLSLPAGPLGSGQNLDSKLGGGIGGHVFVGLDRGFAVVPRVDYTYFKNSDNHDLKVQSLKVGADCDYFFSRKANEGLYAGLGLGYDRTKFEADSADSTTNAVYYAAQAGYMFTKNYGAELRYTYTNNKPEFSGLEQRLSSPVVSASFVCHF
ncbi:outer membrane beta-barrel protein [Holophaga foetida]|uniref:outer membrane beta-barrel protein n=1 Tax=Holophaga foetida TaxID=35839 RepID=UPI000247182D|nr:outer membrane beta-barrel protein [Holophaga foetida]